MIENCIGTYELPLGLGLNFLINGQPLVVPMATEEPSVIAAVSGAAKTIAQGGGFTAQSTPSVMLSQVQILEVEDPLAAARTILDNKVELIAYGNTFCTSMVKRGGGVVDIRPRIVPYSRKKYNDVVDKDEWAEKYNKIDLDELVTKFDKSRVYPNGQMDTSRTETTETTDATMLIVHILIDVCVRNMFKNSPSTTNNRLITFRNVVGHRCRNRWAPTWSRLLPRVLPRNSLSFAAQVVQ
jgi:hypothetical protein